MRSVNRGAHFVVGNELYGARRSQQEPIGIGPEDLDAEAHAVTREPAADADSCSSP
jgi:hypothetical protein